MKVAVNRCYGGFGLSPKAQVRYWELKGRKCFFFKYIPGGDDYVLLRTEAEIKKAFLAMPFDTDDVDLINDKTSDQCYREHCLYLGNGEDKWRADPHLIQVIEEMGEEANESHAEIEIVDVPDNVEWFIEEYDGMEHVSETHRTW